MEPLSPLLGLPVELIDEVATYLEPIESFFLRFVCKVDDTEVFAANAQKLLGVWKTSLMGADVKTLNDIAESPELRSYVETIWIEDDESTVDYDNLEQERRKLKIWPRKDEEVRYDDIGIKDLQLLLATELLNPEKIVIRNCGFDSLKVVTCISPPKKCTHAIPAVQLAHVVLKHVDIALISMDHGSENYPVYFSRGCMMHIHGVTLSLLPERQNQKAKFSLLRSAKVLPCHPDWMSEISCHAAMLEELTLIGCPYALCPLSTVEHVAPMPDAVCELKSLSLESIVVDISALLATLASSRSSLTKLRLSDVRLRRTETWCNVLTSLAENLPNLSEFQIFLYFEHVSPITTREDFQRFGEEISMTEEAVGLVIKEVEGLDHTERPRIRRIDYQGQYGSQVLKKIAFRVFGNKS